MYALLSAFNNTDPRIQASAVTSIDGVALGYAHQYGGNEDHVCGMGSALFAVGKNSIASLLGGDCKHLVVTGEQGYVLVALLSQDVLLVAVTQEGVDLPKLMQAMDGFREDFLLAQ